MHRTPLVSPNKVSNGLQNLKNAGNYLKLKISGNELTTLITEPHTPKKDTRISTETFGFETVWKVVFEVYIDGITPDNYKNMFRITKEGTESASSNGSCGNRYPGVWYYHVTSLSFTKQFIIHYFLHSLFPHKYRF